MPNHPSGMVVNVSLLPNLGQYANVSGAVVHAWRPGHWYTNMFELSDQQFSDDTTAARSSTASRTPSAPPPMATKTLMFSKGGTQGAEGVTDGEAWYIENVLAELDIGREWYHDRSTQTLIYKPNATDHSTVDNATGVPNGQFVATSLKVLFNVTGTKARPAHHITIQGVTLRDTEYTYFEPHGLPSGGDWALQKQGAVTLVGTEDVTINGNLFTRLDGNAIFIGGYHRRLVVSDNEFEFIGDSAMAA
jgi:hypothetical protein